MYGELWLLESIDTVHSGAEKQISVAVLNLVFVYNIKAQKWFVGSAIVLLKFLVHKCVEFLPKISI
jgi:hypothetical protein